MKTCASCKKHKVNRWLHDCKDGFCREWVNNHECTDPRLVDEVTGERETGSFVMCSWVRDNDLQCGHKAKWWVKAKKTYKPFKAGETHQ